MNKLSRWYRHKPTDVLISMKLKFVSHKTIQIYCNIIKLFLVHIWCFIVYTHDTIYTVYYDAFQLKIGKELAVGHPYEMLMLNVYSILMASELTRPCLLLWRCFQSTLYGF